MRTVDIWISESHFSQMHWCLVLDAQGSTRMLIRALPDLTECSYSGRKATRAMCFSNLIDKRGDGSTISISRLPASEAFAKVRGRASFCMHFGASFVRTVCGAPRMMFVHKGVLGLWPALSKLHARCRL